MTNEELEAETEKQEREWKDQLLGDVRAEEMFRRHQRPRYIEDNYKGQELYEVHRDNFGSHRSQ
jgi:hypothetical protein